MIEEKVQTKAEEFCADAPDADGSSLEGAASRETESEADPDRAEGASEEEGVLEMSLEELKKVVEAILFSTSEPVAVRALADLCGRSVHDVREVVEEMRLEYMDGGRAFRLEDIAGGVQLLTSPAYEPWIRKFRQKQSQSRLSAAAFETLAVIAYKQPITKADLEAIRGVQCGPVIKSLLDRGMVKVVGRDDSLGRPLLYGSTQRFLESFGISNVRDLPQPDLGRQESDGGKSDGNPSAEDG